MNIDPDVTDSAARSRGDSRIVLGLGTSHSPLLAFDAQTWASRANDDLKNEKLNLSDGRYVSYAKLLEERGARYEAQATIERFEQQVALANTALDRLALELERAAPDIAIIIGDDHGELFSAANVPGIAVFYGDEIVMHPWKNTWKDPPAWFDQAMRAYAMDAPHRFPGAPGFARQLIAELMDRHVDVASVATVENPQLAGLGHAFGFVIRRLFGGRPLPVVPILLNTYFEPNNVRPSRCYDLGQILHDSVKNIPGNLRVAVIGSGGLSHFVTDEELDRRVLDSLCERRGSSLRTLPTQALKSGSSEILCWVMAAGALEHLPLAWVEYTPVFRTPAGSGIGLAFAAWRPAPDFA